VKGTTLGTNPNPLFEDGPGPGLEPVAASFSRLSKPVMRVEAPTLFSC
jgi:hypothetical protein